MSKEKITKPYISASVTYYCILCTFMWMSAMSYNIMTKFKWVFEKICCYYNKTTYNLPLLFYRGTSILPKSADRQRFVAYCGACFGLPAFMLLIVLGLNWSDQIDVDSTSDKQYSALDLWRPGFGEESCWFNSCSSALTIFLYV